MSNEKILTLSELAEFCMQNKIQTFSAKEYGRPIACRFESTMTFEDDDESDDESDLGLMHVSVKTSHLEKNRNGSFIPEKSAKKAMPTLKNRPLLAYIHKDKDGSFDFWAHNANVVKDDDGGSHIEYLERQIGSFTEDDPYLYKDEENGKTYVVAKAVIPEDYSRACDIIRNKDNETKVSCEIIIDSMEYNRKNKCLEIGDYYYSAVTLLGSDEKGNQIEEGMEGSKLVVGSTEFSSSTVTNISNNSKEGGNNVPMKLEELLKKYEKTVEDINFDYENMNDSELEEAFDKAFANTPDTDDNACGGGSGIKKKKNSDDPEDKDKDDNACGDDKKKKNSDTDNNACGDDKKKKCSNEVNDSGEATPSEKYTVNITYELSHRDIDSQIYDALYGADRNNGFQTCYGLINTYDDYFVYKDYSNKASGLMAQKYIKNENAITLDGEPYAVYAEYLTDSEKAELDSMRANYAALKQFKEESDSSALHAQREAVLNADIYSVLANDEDYKSLTADMDKYSVDELQNKVDLVFAKHVKKSGSFSMNKNNDVVTKPNKHSFNIKDNNSSVKDDPYPGLFKE